jgi:hypothetical protein
MCSCWFRCVVVWRGGEQNSGCGDACRPQICCGDACRPQICLQQWVQPWRQPHHIWILMRFANSPTTSSLMTLLVRTHAGAEYDGGYDGGRNTGRAGGLNNSGVLLGTDGKWERGHVIDGGAAGGRGRGTAAGAR